MVRYLKKKKLYELAKSLLGGKSDFPSSRSFSYSFYHGNERLEGCGYQIISMSCGYWICIKTLDENGDFCFRNEVFSDFFDGTYHYHSIDGVPVES